MRFAERPFGYTSAKELWVQYAKNKFHQLKTAESINAYYDFIFASGAVGYWLHNENNAPTSIYYNLFMSIYNNTKHFQLKQRRSDHISNNYCLDDPIDENGNVLWDNNAIWDNDEPWIENIQDIDGEHGTLLFYCETENADGTSVRRIYLYEICKQVYDIFENQFL